MMTQGTRIKEIRSSVKKCTYTWSHTATLMNSHDHTLTGYICHRMITSENVPSEAQADNFFVS